MKSKTVNKILLLFGLIVLFATSAAFIFVGSYILHLSGNVSDLYQSTHVFVPTIIILSIGIILAILGLIGFFGCILEKKTLLAIFFTCFMMIFFAEITAVVLTIVFRSKMENTIEKNLTNWLKFYDSEISLKHQIDYIQSRFFCCGVRNYTDWETIANRSVPNSCCSNYHCLSDAGTVPTSPHSTRSLKDVRQSDAIEADVMQYIFSESDSSMPYDIGCLHRAERFIRQKFVIIISIISVVVLLQMVSILSSIFIFRANRSADYEPFNNGLLI